MKTLHQVDLPGHTPLEVEAEWRWGGGTPGTLSDQRGWELLGVRGEVPLDDSELKAAFAVRVAALIPWNKNYWADPNKRRSGNRAFLVKNNFIKSADAVLPYLEKVAWYEHTWVSDERLSINNCLSGHTVELSLTPTSMNHGANANSFPRAAVIALLRAHGIAPTRPLTESEITHIKTQLEPPNFKP